MALPSSRVPCQLSPRALFPTICNTSLLSLYIHSMRILSRTLCLICCLRCCEFLSRIDLSSPCGTKYFGFCFSEILAALAVSVRKTKSAERNLSPGDGEVFKRFETAWQIPQCILPSQSGCRNMERGSQWWVTTHPYNPCVRNVLLSKSHRHCCISSEQPSGINNSIHQQAGYSKYPQKAQETAIPTLDTEEKAPSLIH